MRHRILAVALFPLTFFAGAAQASNLIPNPDFAAGLTDWNASGGGIVNLGLDDGIPTPSSLHLSTDGAPVSGATTSCIQVDDSSNVDLHMFAKGLVPEGSVVGASILAYSDSACTAFVSSLATDQITLGFNSPWTPISIDDAALPAGTASVQVGVNVQPETVGANGEALVDHVEFGPTGTLDDAISIAQEGLSGAWYNPVNSGQGLEFVIDPGTNGGPGSLFGSWYTYGVIAGGTDTQRWYSLEANFQPDDTAADVTIYQNVNGNFNGPPATTAAVVGSGKLTFFSCELALFTYAFDDGGPAGAMGLVRLLPNVECGVPPPLGSDFGLTGAWYDAATSGQGFIVEVNPADSQVFAGWYTYGLDASDAGASGQRWLSLQGSYAAGDYSMDLTIYSSTNGTLDSNATAVTTVPVGLATLTFLTCTTATLDYAFTDGEYAGQVDSIDLVRLGARLANCPFDPL